MPVRFEGVHNILKQRNPGPPVIQRSNVKVLCKVPNLQHLWAFKTLRTCDCYAPDKYLQCTLPYHTRWQLRLPRHFPAQKGLLSFFKSLFRFGTLQEVELL
uniref:Uncharacterized protein n=1 Tax=Sphaerodactylus townsendi TaxID=933632 RepID=A0ACB8FR14_9SAUR